MKRLALLISFVAMLVGANAQTLTEQQRLYYTCKVWGFVKYYHSNVSTCHVNWDSVLLHVLPDIESAASNDIFYDELDTMLAAAGPMAIATYPLPDTLPLELKRNRDWTWIDASGFRSDIQIQLDTIRNNFRPGNNCYVQLNSGISSNPSVLLFPNDNPELSINLFSTLPDSNHRLFLLFDYWNIVRYFYPYNYVCDSSWDSVFCKYSLQLFNASSLPEFYAVFAQITHNLNDIHVYYFSQAFYSEINANGIYSPYLMLENVDSQYVVSKSGISGINVGDIIVSKDGLSAKQWEDSLGKYYAYGNEAALHYLIAKNMLHSRNYLLEHENLILKDSTGATYSISIPIPSNTSYFYDSFYDFHYPCDSLDTILWTVFPCNIGYINMGLLLQSEVDSVYSQLQNAQAIIFDLRNYPHETAYQISQKLFTRDTDFVNFLQPDVTYPGTFYWLMDTLYIIPNGTNPSPYLGKVIVLVNEITESEAEFTAQMLRSVPGSIIIGSQTAGVDGAITEWDFTQDVQVGFTSAGAFYSNGDSTQRIGIVPDTVVRPTIEGIRQHKDEVLETALAIGCRTAVPQVQKPAPTVSVYPNPTHESIQVTITQSQGQASAQITDMAGRYLTGAQMTPSGANNIATINMAQFPTGIYLLTVFDGVNRITRKITKD